MKVASTIVNLNKNGNVVDDKQAATLIHGGKEYFELLLKLINEATDTIHLQTYIFDEDYTGVLIANALKKAVKRNVQVYILVDGYASQGVSKKFVHSLLQSGIHFRFFEPVLKSKYFYFGRRMHHKIFVADGIIALVGGINITDRYNDLPGRKAWLDFALLVRGNVPGELMAYCENIWWANSSEFIKSRFIARGNSRSSNHKSETVMIRINDWVHKKNQISQTYINMLRQCKSNITILSSYFLPGKAIRRSIKYAKRKGIKIRVITAGTSDVYIAKQAERWLYDWLLRNGIQIFEYQKQVLHGKLAVCDEEWTTIGSYNINDISAYASLELNLDIHNVNFSRHTKLELDRLIEHDCKEIFFSGHYAKNVFEQLIRWVSYKTFRMIFHLFTFYFKRHKYTVKPSPEKMRNDTLTDHSQQV